MLTTIDHIKTVRDIAANLREGRIVPYIKEVEDSYIMPAISPALYEMLDKGETEDTILLDGGYFDGPAGRDYCHGIRLAVAYYAYSRVLRNNQVNVTAFGVTQKTSTLSMPSDGSHIESAATDAKKMGDMYLESCVRYLHRNDSCGHVERHGVTLHLEIIR